MPPKLPLRRLSKKYHPMISAPLVHRHRPKIFEDVRGQDFPVAYLSGLILKGRACRNILLHGSIGSGKTSLARIYAKALNCERPSQATGSPCLTCDSCISIEADTKHPAFTELDAPQFRRLDDLNRRMTDLLQVKLKPHGRRVIFIDEAQSLSNPKYKDSYDFLLKRVEEPPPNTSFCFATTAPEKIKSALRSRCAQLKIYPLSVEKSIEYLEDIASKENIPFEREALLLIAGLGERQPRNMLQALDQVSDGGNAERLDVTRERVVDVFGISRTVYLCNYFVTLGRGDFALQTKAFFDWNETVQVKARLIQLFLVSMYYNDLCAVGVPIDFVIASIRVPERLPILDAFRQRLGPVNLKHFFEDMMTVWPVVTSALSDEALLMHVIRLQRLANRSQATRRVETVPDRIPEGSITRKERVRRVRVSNVNPPLVRIPKLKRDPNYLTIDNAAQLIRSASFAVQEHGIKFNTQIMIRHTKFGCKTQEEASDHFARFSKALDSRLKAWVGYGHRLCVQEVNEADGFSGRVVAFIADERAQLLRRWSERWDHEFRVAGEEDHAITFEIVPAGDRLEAHWRCVRWLCGGLNQQEPLAARLNIEPEFRRVAGDIGQRTRMPISDSLKPGKIENVENEAGLKLLSAFDDQAWDRLYDGWELEEHLSRMMHTRLRQAAIEEVRQSYAHTPEEQAGIEAALVELRASWPDKYARERSWPVWSFRQ
jgi:DNA polymerase III subunit gamma/tau